MDKASKALRRSSVRLKSMSCGHRELNMVISELKDVRSTAKAFAVAQNTATQDMLKWSVNEENPAIQDTFVQLAELNAIWTEVQREFTDHLKEFITQFEMILEGEQHIDQARTHVTTCELRAAKIKKELKKTSKRGTADEVQQLEAKLSQAERSCDHAQFEVLDRIQENEAVKLIRVKEGLLKLSDSYLELSHKCHVIHEAHRDIAVQVPEVHNKDLHEIRYLGPGQAKQAVQRAKEQIHAYRRHIRDGSVAPCAPIPDGPPPPYSPRNHGPPENSPYNPHYLPQCPPEAPTLNSSNPFHSSPERFNSQQSLPEASGECPPRNRTSFSPSTNPFDGELEDNDSRSLESSSQSLDLAANPNYEEDLAGAVARVKT